MLSSNHDFSSNFPLMRGSPCLQKPFDLRTYLTHKLTHRDRIYLECSSLARSLPWRIVRTLRVTSLHRCRRSSDWGGSIALYWSFWVLRWYVYGSWVRSLGAWPRQERPYPLYRVSRMSWISSHQHLLQVAAQMHTQSPHGWASHHLLALTCHRGAASQKGPTSYQSSLWSDSKAVLWDFRHQSRPLSILQPISWLLYQVGQIGIVAFARPSSSSPSAPALSAYFAALFFC